MDKEEKMKIVINNYFKKECSVNTSIREAFEKGFRIGVSKVQEKQGEWQYTTHYARRYRICPFCKSEKEDDRSEGWFYCWHCGAKMKGDNK